MAIAVFVPNMGVVGRNGLFDARTVDEVATWKTARGADKKRGDLQASSAARMPGVAANYRAILILPLHEAWARHCAVHAEAAARHAKAARLRGAVEAAAQWCRKAPFTLETSGVARVITLEEARAELVRAAEALCASLKDPAMAEVLGFTGSATDVDALFANYLNAVGVRS